MQREELIRKWLDNELSEQESEAFKSLEEYDELLKISNSLKHFKAPEYDTSEELNTLLFKTNNTSSRKSNWYSPLLKVAAILAICFSAYYYTTNLDTTLDTQVSEKTRIELPDNSKVTLNALSNITYNKKNWETSRDLNLEGEAYFKVEKGSQFSVNTDHGKITVLGTEFNVKQRHNLFEVICYEGSVKVDYKTESKILKPGDSFLILDGKYIAKEKENTLSPTWITNESYFKSLPFKFVLNEFERQYNISIDSKNIDTAILFTGSFTHQSIEQALQAISIPLNLTYNRQSNRIVLTPRE